MPCTLCDLPTPDPPLAADEVDGEFCCQGCLEVARRLDDPAAADAGAVREGLDGDDPAPEIPENAETAYLQVDGMHCTTCEAFLESVATDDGGVHAAEASYSAGLLKVTYDPDVLDAGDLPALVDGLGYTAGLADSPPEEDGTDLGRLLVGGFFGMMTMAWYVLFLYPVYLGLPADALLVDLSGTVGTYLLWNLWVMATIVLGYTGYPILRGAYVSLRAGRPNMDLLVTLAAVTAYAYSALAVLVGHAHVYFDVSVVVVMAVSLGGYYEERLRERATGRLADVAEGRVADATRRTADGTETVTVEDLQPDDEVVVGAGERVPVDGEVIEGTAAVDRSLVTGESLPVRVDPGEEVIGGAAVTGGRLVVAPDPEGTSTVDRLLGTVWEVASTRAGAQRLADRLAAVFVPLVVVLAASATAVHLALGAAPTAALLTGLAVLVVSCPCALGLATPLAVAAGVRDALRGGIVIASASVFERATDADLVALDKTGTLTTGEMSVVDVAGDPDGLDRAAAVERHADHPVADAIVEYASGEGTPVTDGGTLSGRAGPSAGPRGDDDAADDARVTDVETHPGRGIGARVDGQRVLVGNRSLFAAEGWRVPDDLAARSDRATESGRVPTLVGWDGRARTVIVAGDQARDGWEAAVDALAADRRVVVVSGDSRAATERFAAHPAVDDVFAGVPPEAKSEVVQRLRTEGTVAMVGDGSNDAPALAAADVGIAMGGGTALATDAADAVVVDDDLEAVPRVFDLTAATQRRVRGNLAWALLYNAVAVPAAAFGLLNPLVAAVAMAASSLLVVANSSRQVIDDD